MPKRQRVRDPIHDLIEFGTDKFEQGCWQVVRTAPFQRLRRIKQLGFSELVYPGATHSRLAHSLGVFHTARQLAQTIKRNVGEELFGRGRANTAIAAALVHDIGHGPFSHAFEHSLETVGIAAAHEDWSVRIILETDVRDRLEEIEPGLSDEVAQTIKAETPANIYNSIVSSQFDADRLDYMRRDRLMSGSQHAAIDFPWLIANLEIENVPIEMDGKLLKKAQTFVLSSKAVMAAEAYVLGLFHLYPTVYFHKATRGAERIFSALLTHTIQKIQSGDVAATGLPDAHPLVRFGKAPTELDAYLDLDDSVITGALPLLRLAKVPAISQLATRLWRRELYKCVDVTKAAAAWAKDKFSEAKRDAEARKAEAKIRELVAERALLDSGDDAPHILEDVAERPPYKHVGDSSLERIWTVGEDGALHDLGKLSKVVGSLARFHAYRLYYGDDSGKQAIDAVMEEVLQ